MQPPLLHNHARYDGDGNRVQKSNGKLYWYGPGGEVLDESDASGNITDEYVYFAGLRIAHRDSSGNVYYYFEDHLGTSRIVTNATGTMCYDADFYPFGGERVYTNTCPQNYKFSGKERDAETGNDDFGARYYSSSLGRFTIGDWSAVPVAVPYADMGNPQTLNLYAYVKNNPLRYTDPSGHEGIGGFHTGNSDRQTINIGGGGLDANPSEGVAGWIVTVNGESTFYSDYDFASAAYAQAQAQNQAWSSLSAAQQALVTGGEKAWDALSGTQQANFAAITHGLEVTKLSNGASALSEIKSVTAINDTNIAVAWNAGAAKALQASGFASRPGWGHPGESGMIGIPTANGKIKGSFFQAQGIHALFNDANKGATGHVHIDYRGLFSGHYGGANADVRQNYQTYKQWFGPIPGYVP